jgi:hypothetical protein
MTEETKKGDAKPARIIKNVDAKPCGCRITEYSDGAKMIAPCVPCGLNAAAESLHHAAQAFQGLAQAAQALAAVATTIRAQQQAPLLDHAARSALRPVT